MGRDRKDDDRRRWGARGFAASLAGLLTLTLAGPAAASPPRGGPGAGGPEGGFEVVDGRIVDANGEDVMLRGVSYPHTWYADSRDTAEGFAGIASYGANAVRVVLGSGQRGWGTDDVASVTQVVDACIANQLVCVLEVHDTTGYGDEPDAATLDEAVDFWFDVRDAIDGYEDVVIINIGNEPMGNDPATNATWAEATSAAIERLRAGGFDHLLMVDAPNWGQDWQGIMRDEAPAVFASDPHANTVFSIHMYGVYEEAARITDYLESFVDRGLPLVVGEFGHLHSDGDPDEDTIMAETRRLGLGLIGWSWSGNSGGVEYLDLVEDFDRDRLTPWGERLFLGPDGFAETAHPLSVFARPASKDDCKRGGWATFRYPSFTNQGRCVASVARSGN